VQGRRTKTRSPTERSRLPFRGSSSVSSFTVRLTVFDVPRARKTASRTAVVVDTVPSGRPPVTAYCNRHRLGGHGGKTAFKVTSVVDSDPLES